MDRGIYHSALQNQWTWSGLKAEAKELLADTKVVTQAKLAAAKADLIAKIHPEIDLQNLNFVNFMAGPVGFATIKFLDTLNEKLEK